jgi:biopolymer transport protein ExbD
MMDDKPITIEQIAPAIRDIVAKSPETQAVISADQDTHHGDVVKVMDALKKAGMTKFAIQIEKQ